MRKLFLHVISAINKSLGLIGVSLLKRNKALTTASYLPKKKKKVHKAVSEKFESVCGSTSSEVSRKVTQELKGMRLLYL